MRLTLFVLAVAVLATPALALEGPEKFFAKAEIAMKEGRMRDASEGFELVIREWPDDSEITPKAWLQLAVCLAKMGEGEKALRVIEKGADRYEGREDWLKHAHALAGKIKEHEKAREAARRFRRDEEDLRQKDLDRLVALWKEQGVPSGEIKARLMRMEVERAREEARRMELERFEVEIRQEGVPTDEAGRRVAERRRELEAEAERHWRKRHEDGMAEARHEFIRLAERLGIPADAAERFLLEHRRSDRPFHSGRESDDRSRPREGPRFEDRMRELEERLGSFEERVKPFVHELEERLEDMEHRVERAHEAVERELGDTHRGMERELAERVEGLERAMAERLEQIEEEIGGVFEKLIERLERMEERLEKSKAK